MIKSMTGYGKGVAVEESFSITVEMRSVNHRHCDISIKAPRVFMAQEADLKRQISAFLKRGKIDLFVQLDAGDGLAAVPQLNRELASRYINLFRQMQSDYQLDGALPISLVTSQKDVLTLVESEIDNDLLAVCMQKALADALASLVQMRRFEGKTTAADIGSRLVLVRQFFAQVIERAPYVPLEWQQRYKERIARLCQDHELDEQRLAQEVAVFSDRCDISEEISRLESHLQQFDALMESDEPVGRKMDFLLQELNREVNTMGSKSNDTVLSQAVVAMKAELEKIREQVQNIE